MSKFENAWRSGYNYYARINDGTSRKVAIPSSTEYYEPNERGDFKYILDQSQNMARRLGKAKDAANKFGIRSPIDVYIRDNYWSNSGYNDNPRIWYLDIETRADGSFPDPEIAEKEITLIQIFDSILDVMIVLGVRDYQPEPGYELEYKVKYVKCSDEIDLLNKYIQVFKKLDPLVVYAWNGLNFDYPYIYNRLKNVGLDPNSMSNYGDVSYRSKKETNFLENDFNAQGHFYIDMIVSYKKITVTNRAGYSLDYIANYELGEGKVDHSEFSTFDSFYTGDNYIIRDTPYEDKVREEIRQLKIKEKNNALTDTDKTRLVNLLQFQFVYYGIKDVYLLKRIDIKINMTNILLSMAQRMGCLFSDTLTTMKGWANYIANVCYQKRLALPGKTENSQPNIVGGFVRDPEQGKHTWVMSFDYNSMYPMNIVGFNMSADTFVPLAKCPSELRPLIMQYFNDQDEEKVLNYGNEVWDKVIPLLQKYKLSMGINGALFSVEQEGVIPNLVWDIYSQRKKDKKKMLSYEKQKEVIADILVKRSRT